MTLVSASELLNGFGALMSVGKWLAVMICWMASVFIGQGQSLPDWLAKDGVPKPPDFGIRDEGGFFHRDSGAFKRISDQFRQLEADHGYRIYLLVEPVLIGSTSTGLAAELRQAWLPEGDGLVVVFEADTRNLGIGRDLGVVPDPETRNPKIPTHETAALIERAVGSVDPTLAPEAYIEMLMGRLVEECNGYFLLRQSAPPGGRSLRIGLLAVGALALLALMAMALGWLVRNSGMREVRSYRFPPVDRPERLGAPCGGSVTARRFAPPAARQP